MTSADSEHGKDHADAAYAFLRLIKAIEEPKPKKALKKASPKKAK